MEVNSFNPLYPHPPGDDYEGLSPGGCGYGVQNTTVLYRIRKSL